MGNTTPSISPRTNECTAPSASSDRHPPLAGAPYANVRSIPMLSSPPGGGVSGRIIRLPPVTNAHRSTECARGHSWVVRWLLCGHSGSCSYMPFIDDGLHSNGRYQLVRMCSGLNSFSASRLKHTSEERRQHNSEARTAKVGRWHVQHWAEFSTAEVADLECVRVHVLSGRVDSFPPPHTSMHVTRHL